MYKRTILVAALLVLAFIAGTYCQRTTEVVCDHPDWRDDAYAAIAAQCDGGVTVVILD